jgi:hypothetical protein
MTTLAYDPSYQMPPLAPRTAVEQACINAAAKTYFPRGIMPDDDTIRQDLTVIPVKYQEFYLDCMVTLLPKGVLTPRVAQMITVALIQIMKIVKSTGKVLDAVQRSAFLKELPSEEAGLHFMHLYRQWFIVRVYQSM